MIQFNPLRIRIARDYRGYSQKTLAKMLKKTAQSRLSKIENGTVIPSIEDMEDVSSALEFPISFFEKKDGASPYLKEFYYRRNLGISNKQRAIFEAEITIMAEQIDDLMEAIDFDYELPYTDIYNEEISPEALAEKIRVFYSIEKGPIKSLIPILQSMGIIIHFFHPPFSLRIDGVSFITKNGYPIILINSEISNSRKVFTIAHELGHLLMHYKYMVGENRDIENEANSFASEFLMPKKEIITNLYSLTAEKLCNLKIYWKVSIKSIIFRAKTLGCLSGDQYKRWLTLYNKYKWYAGEPYEFAIDKPKLLDKVFELHLDELEYSEEELLNMMNITQSDLLFMYDLDTINKYYKKERPKMKIIF